MLPTLIGETNLFMDSLLPEPLVLILPELALATDSRLADVFLFRDFTEDFDLAVAIDRIEVYGVDSWFILR